MHGPTSDPTNLDAILGTLAGAWNDKDGARWASVFAEDARYVDVFGTLHDPLPREANARLHDAGWSTVYRTSTARFEPHARERLGPDLELLWARARIDFEVEGQPRRSENVVSMLVRDGLIVGFHNTPVRPRPGGPG